jgi:TRAP-type mannitol/chloroaromatic compound transport system permease large subunit
MGPDALIWFGLGSLPFVGLQVAVLALIIAVPGLVDWFPRLAAAMTPKPQT